MVSESSAVNTNVLTLEVAMSVRLSVGISNYFYCFFSSASFPIIEKFCFGLSD